MAVGGVTVKPDSERIAAAIGHLSGVTVKPDSERIAAAIGHLSSIVGRRLDGLC